jgi:hypothetical protein
VIEAGTTRTSAANRSASDAGEPESVQLPTSDGSVRSNAASTRDGKTPRSIDFPPVRSTENRVVDCPAEWDGHTTRRDLGLLERASARESGGYLERVEAWNRSRSIAKRTPREFLRYVGLTD